MVQEIRIVQVGFGSLGAEIFKVLHKNKKIKLVGVMDIDKSKVGKDCGVLLNKKKTGVRIVKTLDDIPSKPDIIIHATTSDIKTAHSQIKQIAKKKSSIISTCEELVYPYGKNKKVAKKIHQLAKKHKIRILAVGVNPGFLMDSMLLMLSSLCTNIRKITITRVVDIAKRRRSLQKKMCVGFTISQFNKIKNSSGHVGLAESAMMIANSLNLKLKLDKKTRPILAKKNVSSNGIMVKRGTVSGIYHRLVGKAKNSEFLELNLHMYVGAKEYDLIDIKGIPPLYIKTKGISGDSSTIALILNYIPIILAAKPGLHTVNKLEIPSYTT